MSIAPTTRINPPNARRRTTAAVMTLFLIVAAVFVPLPAAASAPRRYTVDVTARQFAFEPATLNIQRGDTVTLHLESADAAHGMSVDGYGIDLHAEPGKSAEITFVADQAGKFQFRCSVTCGVLHPFMIGEMNVGPDFPFARAAAATVIAMVGALVWFWK